MQLLPTPSKQHSSDTEEEIDHAYAGMAYCYHADVHQEAWIVDSGAFDHMTGSIGLLLNPVHQHHHSKINSPNGKTSVISHKGSVSISPSLTLKDVLHIPSFKHNLLSVQKLSRDEHCKVIFEPTKCYILDDITGDVKGTGFALNGLYYLSTPILSSHTHCVTTSLHIPDTVVGIKPMTTTSLWHSRLGHAPIDKIKKLPSLSHLTTTIGDVCLTCPLAKFTKKPYLLSESRASKPFALVHIDIWGAYKVPTKGQYRYFLTIVDDFSRIT